MKKSKLSLCLASSFVAALSLAACNSVSAKDDAVVTIKNYDGTTTDILTDAAYSRYKTETDGVSKFYNAILEALIRYEYANPKSAIRTNEVEWPKAIKTVDEIKSEAENNVQNDKNTADQNAKTNDTSYETEWEAILKSHNCEDEAELLEYYIYQLEKEDITDKYFLEHKDSTLLTEWIGVTDDGEDAGGDAKGVFPYHIRHVLTSISGGNTDFYSGTITSAEAKNLSDTMKALGDKEYSFAKVAESFSGDSGSAAKGGDVGIMGTTTSFVNEFKLGIYAYDALFSPNRDDDASSVIEEGLGITNTYTFDLGNGEVGIKTAWTDGQKGINNGEITTVPFGAFTMIGELAKVEKDEKNKLVNDGNEHYYPRNVLYNYYLNFHNPFVITKQGIDDEYGWERDFTAEENEKYGSKFVEVDLKGQGLTEVLTDGEGHVIVGCRSEHGIHFMIMEKSIYEYSEGGNGSNKTSLEDYYTSLTTNDSDYPHDADDNPKDTYVSYQSDIASQNTRASEIKSAVKSFDSTYDYRLFQYILDIEGPDKIIIKDEALEEAIYDYISRTRESNWDNAEKTLHEAWRSYTELVALQFENRTDDWDKTDETVADRGQNPEFRTIHPRCAVGFKKHSGAAWQQATDPDHPETEGICYYGD